MPRLIDADALASVLEEWEEKACDGTENDGSDGTTRVLHPVPTTTRDMIDLIADQNTIEAEPVKHGEWVPVEPGSDVWFRCSECEVEISTSWNYDLDAGWNFCPHCGADMRERRDNNAAD